jgi:hypothetical protein
MLLVFEARKAGIFDGACGGSEGKGNVEGGV